MNTHRVNRDFKDLPFDRINFNVDGKSTTAWTWCIWGEGDYAIENHVEVKEPNCKVIGSTIHDAIEVRPGDLVTYSYSVPKAIVEMLERQFKKGREEALTEVRSSVRSLTALIRL